MSLTEALRAGAPQAFGALYDEYAGALHAYCHVMVGDEADDALRDVLVTVARHPDAVPGEDAELPVWLHSLARTECVRRGALVRGVVTATSADPLRRALALVSPGDREVLALSNALSPEQTAQILDVTPDTVRTLVPEAERRLEQAAASVGEREAPGSAMLAPLSAEALHRLVTAGRAPSRQQREWVLSACAAARGAPGGAAVFDADGTPLGLAAFSARADDDTHRFPAVSPDEAATAPLHRIQPAPAGAEVAGSPQVADGEHPPPVRAAHARPSEPFLRRRLLPVAILAACVAAVTGTAIAWPDSHPSGTRASVRQSAPPGRTARPAPSGDDASPPVTSGASPTPDGTTAAPTPTAEPTTEPTAEAPPSTPAPDTATPAPPEENAPARPTARPSTTRPKPHHTGHRTTGPRRPGRTCPGTSGRGSRCGRPRPWRSTTRVAPPGGRHTPPRG